MTSIFLSYSRNDDEAFVRRLHADLTNAGFDVWFDRVSMPSRQLTFHQEIRDAIAVRERLLLVVGPGVPASDYVTQEWRFAYFEAGKCLNPIVRLDGRGASGVPIDGYDLIPEDLKLLHAEDFRDDAHYDAHLANLIRQLSEEISPVGKLVAVPELPVCFLAQPDRIKALRDLLLVDLQKPVVVSGAAARVGLQGMGGIGKSVLASALAHRPEVRRAFPDGVYWITLGQKPQLAELQRWLAKELGDAALFADERSGKETLRKLLAGRKSLLVLDDVWQREDAEAFNVIGAMGRILLTTRDAGLVTALASKETHYRVELPTEAEAEGIFAAAAELKFDELPVSVREIVAQCGRLPLALALCGGMVQGGISPADVLEALREHDLEFLSSDHPAEEQHRNAWKAMDVSLRVLPPEQRDRFAELAVFALDRGAPEAAVVTLWEHTGGLTPRHARKLLADFAARSLVQLSPAKEVGGDAGILMTLHDLLHNFAAGMSEKLFGSRLALHQKLLDAYRKKCPSGWPSGPDDGYFLESLCEHLVAAGRIDDAVELLTDLPWIQAECKAKLVFSLQDDYRSTIAVLPEWQERLRQDLHRKAQVTRWTSEITEYSRQWSERRDRLARGETVLEPEPQMPEPPPLSTLRTITEEEGERNRIAENPTRLDRFDAFATFVERELHALMEFGQRPEFVGLHAFNNISRGPVHEVAAQFLTTLDMPLLVRRWSASDQQITKPSLQRTLEGHTDSVLSVSMTADGRRAVSGGAINDSTVRWWDLESGKCLRTFKDHNEQVLGVKVTPDGHRAISGGSDCKIRVWDMEAGICLRTLHAGDHSVECVDITPDGRLAVSGSKYGAIQVWDLDAGVCLRTLDADAKHIHSVSVTPDGRWVASCAGNDERTLWTLETGECVELGKLEESIRLAAGDYRVSDGIEGSIEIMDMNFDRFVHRLVGRAATSLTPDGRRLVSTAGYSLIITDTCAQAVWALSGHSDKIESMSITPDGWRVVSASLDHTLRVWNLETIAEKRWSARYRPDAVIVTPSGWRVVSGDGRGTVRIRDLNTGKDLREMKEHTREINNICVTPDGLRAISASDDYSLRVWDLESGACLQVMELTWVQFGTRITHLCVTPDGLRAVSTTSVDKLQLWDLQTGVCLREMEGHSRMIWDVCVTPDGLRAISASMDCDLKLWNLENGECLRVLKGHTGWVTRVSPTPDGRNVVSGGSDCTLRVWDLETGECLRVLNGHTDRVFGVCVTPDGRHIVSGSDDKTLRVWDVQTGECLALERGDSPWGRLAFVEDILVAVPDVGSTALFKLQGL